MTPGSELMERVRTAQAELGTGDAADALQMVEPLLVETAEALRALDFLTRSPADRRAVVEAFCYARVTAVLALESAGADTATRRIRVLAGEALEVAAEGNAAWKVLCAAAEMLSRAGDAEGAAAAITAGAKLAPDDEEYVRQLRGSIRSMFPAAFARDSSTD